ncbi:MAG: VOC family protein [Oenococcus sp.]|uniref:VOC family protein n=1 Tax=Oenococcus TaxID=46254 RepID=UPI0021E7214E|nr:VOC family protein [Oenococcus kitaharae]MCV3296387.1 VOC family protein [Oenococcus kitaharae]
MLFTSLMHVSFYAKDIETIREFYVDKLEGNIKMLVRNSVYRDQKGHPFYERAQKDPQGIAIIYFELAPGQFVEFFPAFDEQKPHTHFNEYVGYSHFSLLVDDIQQTKEKLINKDIAIDSGPSIGNSHTWQMWIHDPEGNRIEIMQYTDQSYQIVGNIQEKDE